MFRIIFHDNWDTFSPVIICENSEYHLLNLQSFFKRLESYKDNNTPYIYDPTVLIAEYLMEQISSDCWVSIENLSSNTIEILRQKENSCKYIDHGYAIVDVSEENFGKVCGLGEIKNLIADED